MKKILAVIILLMAIPFCVVVWAGLDAAGGSLINCRTISSDTSTLTINDNLSVNGNLAFDTSQRTIAGIKNQNLLDGNASEVVSGDWLFYSSPLTISGSLVIDGTAQISGGLEVSGPISGGSPVVFGDDIIPETDNSHDVGSTDYYWRNLYITGDISSAPTTVGAWEVDGSDDLMPVTGAFNDLYYDLDSNGDLMPTLLVHFVPDTSGNLMPIL